MLSLKGNESRSKVSEFKLSTLLEITNAINNNLPEDQLFVLFQYILQHQLNIGKAVVFLRQVGTWRIMIQYGVSEEELMINVDQELRNINDITVVEMIGGAQSKSFDVVIPVYHQSNIIAYLLLGDLDEQELRASPIIKHLPFIQTLANITAVAVENKRLARESLRQERMNRELEMASEMQGMLLPKSLPNDHKLQVSALYRPHQEVGGDFYDVILTESEIFFCVADVSGKGISAAILMASFQANLRAHVQAGADIRDIVHNLNTRVWQNANGERFITLFLAKYDIKSRVLEYVNAAHPAPILLHENNIHKLADGCIGLGMFDELPFVNTGQVRIEPGALLVCYTDGLNELENELGELFEDERLINILKEQPFGNMEELNRLVLAALNQHKGSLDFHDDIALISSRFF